MGCWWMLGRWIVYNKIILILNRMFTYSYQNRFQMDGIQGNIIMNQIRAEQHTYQCINTPTNTLTQPTNFKYSKKMYQELRARPTLSPQQAHNHNLCCSSKSHRGKKMVDLPVGLREQRSRSGKKQYDDVRRRDSPWGRDIDNSGKSGKKRLDYSPSNQNRTNVCLKWDRY